jgi:hypothetical protein
LVQNPLNGGLFIKESGPGISHTIGHMFKPADAEFLVEAVNNYEVLIQERRRLIGELDAAKVHADSEKRWANAYFEDLREAEAHLDHFRDLARRLADALGTFAALEDHEIDLLREAREALGKDKP